MSSAATPRPPADRARPHPAPRPARAAGPDADAAVTQRVVPPAPLSSSLRPSSSAPWVAVPPPRAVPSGPGAHWDAEGSRPWPGRPQLDQPSAPRQAPWWAHGQLDSSPTPLAGPWQPRPGAGQTPGPALGQAHRFAGPNPGAQVSVDLGQVWPGGQAFGLRSPHPVPREVQRSFLLWVAVAGLSAALLILSLIGQLGSTESGGLGGTVLLLLFSAGLVYGAAMMRHGHRWARILNLVLGFFASWVLLSGVLFVGGVFTLFFAASATGYSMSGSDTFALFLAGVSGLAMLAIVGAMLTATVFMFKRQASAYLSAARRA